jgi:hypothetical protein
MTTPKICLETREQLIKELAIIIAKAASNNPVCPTFGGVYGIVLYSPVIVAEMLVDGKPKSEIMDFLTKQNDKPVTPKCNITTNEIKEPYLKDIPYDSDLLK